MSARGLRVLIADDHAILRSGLRRLFEDMPEVEMVGEANNAASLRQQMRAQTWSVVLLDLDMPGQNALDGLRTLKADHPDAPLLVFSMYPEEQYGLRALKAGAAGYLSKDCETDELVQAVMRISEGGAYMSPTLSALIARQLYSHAPDATLTDREFAVLRGLAAGKSIVRIAEEINLSAKTVSTYRARLLRRLGLRNNVELARYATDHGIVK